MKQRAILNLHSDKQHPPRFCDVVVDDQGNIELVKKDKDQYEKIPWNDVVYQVGIAKEMAQIETE